MFFFRTFCVLTKLMILYYILRWIIRLADLYFHLKILIWPALRIWGCSKSTFAWMSVQKVRSLGCGEKWTVGVGTNAHTNVRSKTNNEGNLTNHKVTDRIPEKVLLITQVSTIWFTDSFKGYLFLRLLYCRYKDLQQKNFLKKAMVWWLRGVVVITTAQLHSTKLRSGSAQV